MNLVYDALTITELVQMRTEADNSAQEWRAVATTAESGNAYAFAWWAALREISHKTRVAMHNRARLDSLPCDCGLCGKRKRVTLDAPGPE
ncbi:hypothetical protein ACQPYK_09410 [Streptosporangium sp. CA-135522]|uniref:hypothetical protein n=1 Tax=Streptosporangium sp. CA-135522 TaxID=3240072 RepID=UPI003D8D4D9F